MPRPRLYRDLAFTASKQATCPKLRVGCVLVKDGRILSLGYNGACRGQEHCEDVGCDLALIDGRESCQRAVHAEANALLNAAYVGAATKGAVLYCTHSPCYHCAKLLLNAGVKELHFETTYSDPRTFSLWSQPQPDPEQPDSSISFPRLG